PAGPGESRKARGDQYDASGCGNTRRARRGGRGPAEATVADPDVACERSRLVALVSVQRNEATDEAERVVGGVVEIAVGEVERRRGSLGGDGEGRRRRYGGQGNGEETAQVA